MTYLRYERGSVTDIETGVIGHGVDTSGKMTAGVALAIVQKWPVVKERYLDLLSLPRAHRELGSIQIVNVKPELYVLNMFTQRYGQDGVNADKDAIFSCVEWAIITAEERKLPLYLPKVGSGPGGLDWKKDVEPIVAGLAEEHKYIITIREI
jgi:O-acetyl-ADP-ribose deacetylase (regulator of RNase III)